MIDPDALHVWHNQDLVGYLWRNQFGYLGFRYATDWIGRGGFPVSQSLHLREEPHTPESGKAHHFFANLLPEGNVRAHIVRDLKIADSDFDLLRAIGGECAGALSILADDQDPTSDYHYRRLDEAQLEKLILRRGQIYAGESEEDRPRLSLAGAQDKCPVLLRDDQFYLPQENAPSSHIFKFEITDYRHLPAYEVFTSWLAHAVGLPVVELSLQHALNTHYALITRYDRYFGTDDKVHRYHQEDFCQALGYSAAHKYQDGQGPTFAQCLSLLRKVSTEPAVDTLNLLRWQIFNVLAGNSDGHAKNLSLLYDNAGQTRLAPFYDLVCTRAIERVDTRLGFFVAKERLPSRIAEAHWQAFAKDCDVRPKFLLSLVEELQSALCEQIEPVRQEFEMAFGEYPALQRVEQVIKKRCT
ncbi:type II toxin-antitoxin system HipA family toxin [Thiohalophilus sp.]|uniref:type II toxin-antitoxin system HipA family toxin n=1 Tax=Thiohalophilus sp. TaxID=3028392 RepID=UPI002ACE5EE6|nr:type II toxin-antitoxin system HipA family toxin [Thiohalophilus sp.]MDZ7662069.1 type II toxin-antitoxin system HipA family toxin [Thiohalophilus sp.]